MSQYRQQRLTICRMPAELGHELWIGDSGKIRASEVRKQKTERRRRMLSMRASRGTWRAEKRQRQEQEGFFGPRHGGQARCAPQNEDVFLLSRAGEAKSGCTTKATAPRKASKHAGRMELNKAPDGKACRPLHNTSRRAKAPIGRFAFPGKATADPLIANRRSAVRDNNVAEYREGFRIKDQSRRLPASRKCARHRCEARGKGGRYDGNAKMRLTNVFGQVRPGACGA